MKRIQDTRFSGEIYFKETDIIAMSNPEIPEIIRNNYGDLILNGMGYNATCICFTKCKEKDLVNIGWMTPNGNTYIQSFSIKNLAEKLARKQYHIEISVD